MDPVDEKVDEDVLQRTLFALSIDEAAAGGWIEWAKRKTSSTAPSGVTSNGPHVLNVDEFDWTACISFFHRYRCSRRRRDLVHWKWETESQTNEDDNKSPPRSYRSCRFVWILSIEAKEHSPVGPGVPIEWTWSDFQPPISIHPSIDDTRTEFSSRFFFVLSMVL